MITRITIEPVALGHRGERYRVTYEGRVLLEAVREPLFDACRALKALGVAGRLEMWRLGKGHYDAAVDIERGARWTVAETAESGPVISPWRPFAREANEHAFPAVPSEAGAALRDLPVGRWPRKNQPSTTRSAAHGGQT